MSKNILEKILRHKRAEIVDCRRQLPLPEIKARLKETVITPACDFAAALRRPGEVALIAEVKRRSPSRGTIKGDFDLAQIVSAYREAGADAVSVLTDREFFGGAPEYLAAAREMTGQPLLRKDFIIDEYQVYEARLLGADAVLLLAGILTGGMLGEFIALARSLGMEALVETRTPAEIGRAMEAGASVVGVNNRDLRTFQVDLNTTLELIKYIDNPEIVVVSESGVKTRADVEMLGACGVHAVLVGEALMTAGDPREGVRRLRGVAVRPREVAGA